MFYVYYKKNLRYYKNVLNMMLDIVVSLCNKIFQKFVGFKYFLLIKKILFFNVNLVLDSFNIVVLDFCFLFIDL